MPRIRPASAFSSRLPCFYKRVSRWSGRIALFPALCVFWAQELTFLRRRGVAARFWGQISLSSCVWALFSEFLRRRSLSDTFLSILGSKFALVVCLGLFFLHSCAGVAYPTLFDLFRHFCGAADYLFHPTCAFSVRHHFSDTISSNLCLQRPF